MTNGGASAFAADSPRGDEEGGEAPLPESPGTPPSAARRAGHPFFNSLLENEVHKSHRQSSRWRYPAGSLMCAQCPRLSRRFCDRRTAPGHRTASGGSRSAMRLTPTL